jgi:hypothetical protein
MPVFTREYHLVWQLKFAPNYQFDSKGNCFNVKTGRQITQILVGYTLGYCINGKFESLTRLRQSLVKIEKQDCPF